MAKDLKARVQEINKLARERRMTLATVEHGRNACPSSVTGRRRERGAARRFIVYTKENKTRAVGVPRELLEKHTAVGAEVAKAMALGALERCPANIVAAITGVAGPEPDEDGNPVGLVFVAAAVRDGRVTVSRHEFGKRGKDEICSAAMDAALDLVEDMLRAHVP